VLPVLFSNGGLYSFNVENECARISDPVSVPKDFIENAVRQQICFLREPLALVPEIGIEIRLKYDVWKSFEVTFTYPPQLQSGRQSFPILIGKLDFRRNHRNGALVLAIRNRKVSENSYLIIAQYRGFGKTDLSVKVASLDFEITLPRAEALVHDTAHMSSLQSCELRDEHGQCIHHTQILELRKNDRFWVDSCDDEIAVHATS
jgi:hypothetical protein